MQVNKCGGGNKGFLNWIKMTSFCRVQDVDDNNDLNSGQKRMLITTCIWNSIFLERGRKRDKEGERGYVEKSKKTRGK